MKRKYYLGWSDPQFRKPEDHIELIVGTEDELTDIQAMFAIKMADDWLETNEREDDETNLDPSIPIT